MLHKYRVFIKLKFYAHFIFMHHTVYDFYKRWKVFVEFCGINLFLIINYNKLLDDLQNRV